MLWNHRGLEEKGESCEGGAEEGRRRKRRWVKGVAFGGRKKAREGGGEAPGGESSFLAVGKQRWTAPGNGGASLQSGHVSFSATPRRWTRPRASLGTGNLRSLPVFLVPRVSQSVIDCCCVGRIRPVIDLYQRGPDGSKAGQVPSRGTRILAARVKKHLHPHIIPDWQLHLPVQKEISLETAC